VAFKLFVKWLLHARGGGVGLEGVFSKSVEYLCFASFGADVTYKNTLFLFVSSLHSLISSLFFVKRRD
jgi:hypothetical protein